MLLPTTFDKRSRAEQDIHWAKIWLRMLAGYHGRAAKNGWDFASGDAIAFSKSKTRG